MLKVIIVIKQTKALKSTVSAQKLSGQKYGQTIKGNAYVSLCSVPVASLNDSKAQNDEKNCFVVRIKVQ